MDLSKVGILIGTSLWICVAGCQAMLIQPTDRLAVVGLDEPFVNASMAQWPADFNRLIYDMPRTFKQLHWGLLGVRLMPGKQVPAGLAPPIVRATALLPDGRTAMVVAWQVGEAELSVALRVGYFGDRDQERRFIMRLAQVLRGKPSRKHRQGFGLPSAAVWPDSMTPANAPHAVRSDERLKML